MSLIARFVFDKGDPVDVRLHPDEKDEFIKSMRDGIFYHSDEGEGGFYANLDHLRFFYISKETVVPQQEIKVVEGEEPVAGN